MFRVIRTSFEVVKEGRILKKIKPWQSHSEGVIDLVPEFEIKLDILTDK
jgi:hypothetical protein